MYKTLYEHLGRFGNNAEIDLTELEQVFIPHTFKKGQFLTEIGKVNNRLAFVASGYFRVFVINRDGDEVTIHLAGNVDFVGAITSFLGRIPSEEYVQAVTDSEILVVTYEGLQDLFSRSQSWEHLGRKIMESLFLRKQQRVISFIQKTAEERYLELFNHEPAMLLQVPMQYIASYLGVKPETLSRIRSRIS